MNKRKIFIILGVCLTIVLVLVGSTFAYYRGVLFNDFTASTITHGLDYYINYAKGQDITSGTLSLSSDYSGGISTDIELWKKDDTYDIYGHIYLDINDIGENLSASSALKYAVVNNDDILSEGNLNGYSNGASILLEANIPLELSKQLYTVYVWLDQNENIDVAMENENLSLTVRCEATMKKIGIGKINDYITNMYINAEKRVVTNNGTEYNYAPSVMLMNDRLGGATTNYDGGNIRYYGSKPNNYIYFNCKDYSVQNSDTCDKWRIIGLFDGKIKIIKDESLGDLAWDYDKNWNIELTTSSNDWVSATLNSLLNVYYYRGKRRGYYSENLTTLLYLDVKGLKNDETRNAISESQWYLGGYSSPFGLYAKDIYMYERTNIEGTTIYPGNAFVTEENVGLMYASDYSYASDLSVCKNDIGSYSSDKTNCVETNWLHTGTAQWLLGQNANYYNFVMSIHQEGSINTNGGGGIVASTAYSVRPTL